ncbi:MAG: hypothetical protein GXO43_01365 [Crenarchaeota archaeon]|nr:hypothetical protein [Thermoproteota archaeon]
MRVKQILSNYFEKTLCEDQIKHVMCVVRHKGIEYLLCISKTGIVPYAKIIRADKVATLDCEMIEYDPRGLYVFADDLESLARRTLEKIEANIL